MRAIIYICVRLLANPNCFQHKCCRCPTCTYEQNFGSLNFQVSTHENQLCFACNVFWNCLFVYLYTYFGGYELKRKCLLFC